MQALVGPGLAVVAVAFAAVMIPLIQHAHKPEPEITAYANGTAIAVGPKIWCPVEWKAQADCDHVLSDAPAQLPLPRGKRLQLSVPEDIANAPWSLVTLYRTADGHIVPRQHIYRSGTRHAVTIESPATGPELVGIEVQLPSANLDPSGIPYIRSYWALDVEN